MPEIPRGEPESGLSVAEAGEGQGEPHVGECRGMEVAAFGSEGRNEVFGALADGYIMVPK